MIAEVSSVEDDGTRAMLVIHQPVALVHEQFVSFRKNVFTADDSAQVID
jgi:hypothetical protein